MEVLVFGGTSEGRELVEWLVARGCDVVACVTTDYGASLLEQGEHVSCLQGPLTFEEKRALVAEHDFACVVDATHPFARHITQSVAELGAACGLDVLRVLRDDGQLDDDCICVQDAVAAARVVAAGEGRVLLTSGSKDLATYAEVLGGELDRLYVRILPLVEAIEQARELGIPASHIVAMQGPFSRELNEALLRQLSIRWLVTKESGPSGGFEQKVEAAHACGVRLVVIERPHEQGLTLAQACRVLEENYGL